MIKAFTLIELVIVIVIIGILSTQISPSFNRNGLQEAANQLVSHIRYTQHLAMMDNKFDPSDEFWYRKRWQLKFHKTVDKKLLYSYSIFSDKKGKSGKYTGNPDLKEVAKNPLNPKQLMSGGFSGGVVGSKSPKRTKSMALTETYNIQSVKFSSECNGGNGRSARIAFDNLGRPFRNNISKQLTPYQNIFLLQEQCKIKLCLDSHCSRDEDRFIEIAVEAETGYIHIL